MTIELIKAALKRFGRGAVAIAIPLAIQYFQNSTDPTIMIVAPALMALGKGLRDKYKWGWLPI